MVEKVSVVAKSVVKMVEVSITVEVEVVGSSVMVRIGVEVEVTLHGRGYSVLVEVFVSTGYTDFRPKCVFD